MKRTNLYMALALAGLCGSANAVSIDFSGYMRATVGANAAGGNQVCFQAPGADTKWRLGNECDYVIEPQFNAKVATYEGSDWHVHFMPNVYHAYGGENADLAARYGQVYAYGTKIAALGNGKVWAGRRFYNRFQLGINDQFLENDDGDGTGVEDMDVGMGKLSVAVMTNPNGNGNDVNDGLFKFPVRLTGIKTVPNGELSVYVTGLARFTSKDQTSGKEPAGKANAGSIGVYQTLNGTFMGGNTVLGVRYDENRDDVPGTKNTRFVVQQSGKSGATSWDAIAEYRVHDEDNPTKANKWFSLGGRTDTHLSGPFRLLLDAGTDQVKPDSGGTRNLTKLTAAVAASAGPDAGSRPTLRLFVTHAVWNEAARLNLDSRLKEVFGDKKAGTSVGVQAEAWW
jgi:maltoporin